uniref:Site-specific integrase n=1 Tax=Desulfatirhabdium butyrativorans TaxID=340467 RepID=A0A7C4VRC5_9BACT
MQRVKTKVQGVRYREHPSRKHGVQPDRYYFIRYRVEGKEREEGLGWASEGWTVAKAADVLAELKRNARTGEGEKTLAEKRAKAEAERQAELDRQRREQEEQEAARKESVPLSVIFRDYYIPFARDNKNSRSCDTEEHLFKNWIEPVIGMKPLKDISAFDCERIKKRMRTAGRADRTIEYVLAVLRQIFSYAKRFKIFMGENPLLTVTKPKYDNRKQRFLTPEETTLLMETLKAKNRQLYLMAMISLHCGLRAGEIFSLTWGDIDPEKGLLMLRDTKNSETRFAFMTESLKQELLTLTPGKPSELVFKDRSGKKITSISATWDRIVNGLGLNDGVEDRRLKFTFHGLRHSFASNLVKIGVDLYRVQKLLGHRTPKMTLRYAHLGQDDLKDAIHQMEAAMNRESKQAEVVPINRAG